MLNKGLIILFGLVLLLTACDGTKTFNFSGESDHWLANLKIIQTGKRQQEDFHLRYLGEDMEQVDELSYEVESVGELSSNRITLNDHGELTGGGSCVGCAFTTEKTEVIVTIRWNDQTETFQLKNSK